MENRQTVIIKYTAIDNESDMETIGGEIRLGVMKLADVQLVEQKILQFIASLKK